MTHLRGTAKVWADNLAWCPAEYLADYQALIAKHFRADEARRIIEDHIAVMERRSRRATAIAA